MDFDADDREDEEALGVDDTEAPDLDILGMLEDFDDMLGDLFTALFGDLPEPEDVFGDLLMFVRLGDRPEPLWRFGDLPLELLFEDKDDEAEEDDLKLFGDFVTP